MKKNVTVQIPYSPEARPVAELVQLANRYNATIYLQNKARKVNAKSIMGMMALGLSNGESVTIFAEGEDAEPAIEALEKYLSNQPEEAKKAAI